MKILFCGDVVGKSGRAAIKKHVPRLREEMKLDFVVVNGENGAGGFGITQDICEEYIRAGADCVTAGDHVWDQKDVASFIGNNARILRPANFPASCPGKGHQIYETKDGKRVAVIHLHGQLFMKYQLNCPFQAANEIMQNYNLGGNVEAIFVDFHAEATSEKVAMGWHLDGRVSAVIGSHTHIPTADAQVLPKGTAHQSDAGMCGDYLSVIGFDPKVPLQGFVRKMRTERMEPASGEGTLCGAVVETDDKTGLAISITPIRVGGAIGEAKS